MAFHSENRLSLNQLQTPANAAARGAAQGGAFPGPTLPSQQFTIQGGLASLNSEESEMLRKVVNRLKRRQQATSTRGSAAGLGTAFRIL